jgi:flagellum-specific peptidoglycan hydrolase FlgJ
VARNLDLIAPAARASELKTGCPGLLQIAQCGLETGWLTSALGNNCFGIKAYDGCYGRQLLPTKEWFTPEELKSFLSHGDGRTATLVPSHGMTLSGRQEYVVHDWFATFATLADCFAKRASLWDKGRYAPAAAQYKVDNDFEKLVRAIAPIYATDPKYADTVLQITSQADVQQAWKEACLA